MTQSQPPPDKNATHTPSETDHFELPLGTADRLVDDSYMPEGLELDTYLEMLEGFDLSEDEKRELVRTLGVMMEGLLDIHFGTDPVSLVLKERESRQVLKKHAEKGSRSTPSKSGGQL